MVKYKQNKESRNYNQDNQNKQPKQTNEEKIITSALQYGMQELLKENPIFEDHGALVSTYVDQRKLKGRLDEIYEAHGLKGKKELSEEDQKYLTREIADYFVSGAALTDKGQEVVLGKGLEAKVEKPSFWSWFGISKKKSSLQGIEYLNNAIKTTRELSYLLKDKDMLKSMPEIAKPLAELERVKLMYPVLRVLEANGLIDKDKYYELANKAHEIAKETSAKIKTGVESIFDKPAMKVAAAVLGFLGILVIGSNLTITGNLIGNLPKTPPSFLGIIFLVVALGLFLFNIKKTKKKKLKKKL